VSDLVERGGDDQDAEVVTVEAAPLGGPVDPPAEHRTLYANVMQGRDEPLAPIVPAVWRNPDQRRAVLRWVAWYAWYLLRFHAVRSPKYAGKTALWTPVGVGRLLGRTVRWATAEEGNWSLRQHAANRNDAETWLKLDRTRERQARWRWLVVLGAAAVLAVGLALLLSPWAPWWVRWATLVGVVPALARLGRPADKPITDRVTTGPRFTRLTGEMVRQAVVALGIQRIKEPGDIAFPPPGIHRDGPGWLARFNLPAGVEAVEGDGERRGRLSSALRLPVDQVWPGPGPEHAGQVDLWVGYLPASKMGQPRWSLASETARTSCSSRTSSAPTSGSGRSHAAVRPQLPDRRCARLREVVRGPDSGHHRRAGPDLRDEDRRVQGHRRLRRPGPAVLHLRLRRRRQALAGGRAISRGVWPRRSAAASGSAGPGNAARHRRAR
jgi:S-DNA-T family DNA segregation ATPase FtsK/SpoIIIE